MMSTTPGRPETGVPFNQHTRAWLVSAPGHTRIPGQARHRVWGERHAVDAMEEATWDDTKVTSIDWRTLHSWSLGSKIPTVESVLIDRPDAEATGVGETSITIVAAAIGNAIFDATGARLRQVPFTPERVKAALAARA